MREAILSLGSNQGDRFSWIKQAGLALLGIPETRVVAISPVYETDPVNVPEIYRHLDYLNCVIIVETSLSAEAFSEAIHAIEKNLKRARGATSGLPRTVDIDILTFGDVLSTTQELALPHPRACTRRFVLQPLADLRPDFIFPGDTRTVSELLLDLPESPRVRRLTEPAEAP